MTQQSQSMVTIPLTEYEELKQIKELKLKEGIAIRESYTYSDLHGLNYYPTIIYKGNEAIEILAKMIKDYGMSLNELQNKYWKIPHKIREKYCK